MKRAAQRPRRLVRLSLVTALTGGAILTLQARAAVVLHEFVSEDPTEDLRFGATTRDGNMAAAIQTESGAVAAPDLGKPAPQKVYGGTAGARPRGATYRVDTNTSRPEVVGYDDPFTPEITPFKREFAYDTVEDNLELVVGDPSLSRVQVEGRARPDDDQFYADLTLDLLDGEAVRIPSVGPGARILGVASEPKTEIDILRDGADNWFVRAKRPGRVRLAMQLAIDRGVFGSSFADTTWSALAQFVKPMNPVIVDTGRGVAERIGVNKGMAPPTAVQVLVSYFRNFAPSDERPTGSGLKLYEELVESQKGVCRHRSFAFVITALAIGLPARMARNEAHAWVEVFDTVRWHRIDLGGAATRVETRTSDRVPHVAPRDPYAWPPGSDSGEGMAERARVGGSRGRTPSDGPAARASRPGPAAAGAASTTTDSSDSSDDSRPRSELTLRLGAPSAVRGSRLPVSGTVESRGEPCALARVDLRLVPNAATGRTDSIALGALVTSDDGKYQGHLVVPYRVPVGDYDVVASTPGSYRCGRGRFP